ncbi:ATP-grasp fold amidoligase family protein [Pseudonocardia sp.]|uniref:ATP-grasp fold amidoligase family protein n=1 Tax=Pseudonocardia sp. TaxID=60912 RepID=UPI00260E90B2|nr:ATP-grasp fold amidoligase family protein [Pseudonocardia sp.]
MTIRETAERSYRAVLDALPVAARRRLLYTRAHRRMPRFGHPQRFTEKVNWRILRDRRAGLAWTCDKLAMKDYAGRSDAGVRVARTLWSGTDVHEIAALELPKRWVLKPNHRSATVHLGTGDPDVDELAVLTEGWLRSYQAEQLGEWAYGQARPTMLLEEWIGESDEPPMDYKFFVFGGRVALVQVDTSRFTGHCRRLFWPDWTPLEVTLRWPLGPEVPRPRRLEQMVAAAAALGEPFDFMRIDLYDDGDTIWFGETTPYPSGGLSPFDPAWLDTALGSMWTLPDAAAAGRR